VSGGAMLPALRCPAPGAAASLAASTPAGALPTCKHQRRSTWTPSRAAAPPRHRCRRPAAASGSAVAAAPSRPPSMLQIVPDAMRTQLRVPGDA
jgi:hypothetical protein